MLLGCWAVAGHAAGTITFASLTLISSLICVVLALCGKERVERFSLNHWDEAAAYMLVHLSIGIVSP